MEKHDASKDSLKTVAPKALITAERKLNSELDRNLPKPYLARALVAVDAEHPNGSKDHDNKGMSVLQQHVAFFDKNNDGIVYPWETYKGFKAIGFGTLISLVVSFAINLALTYPTLPSWVPNPLLPIYISNIHKAKHGSDSEVYDTEGRFDPAKFDAIFSKYAITHGNALTHAELDTMLKANRNVNDFFGWNASKLEWTFLYNLAKDENGLLHKEAVRGVYDGSLFEYMEKKECTSQVSLTFF